MSGPGRWGGGAQPVLVITGGDWRERSPPWPGPRGQLCGQEREQGDSVCRVKQRQAQPLLEHLLCATCLRQELLFHSPQNPGVALTPLSTGQRGQFASPMPHRVRTRKPQGVSLAEPFTWALGGIPRCGVAGSRTGLGRGLPMPRQGLEVFGALWPRPAHHLGKRACPAS